MVEHQLSFLPSSLLSSLRPFSLPSFPPSSLLHPKPTYTMVMVIRTIANSCKPTISSIKLESIEHIRAITTEITP